MPATESAPLLDDQICFALYEASRAMTARYRQLLEPLGVTYPQYLALLVLWQEGETTLGRLGSRLHLDSGTLSPLVRRLEAAGLITRRRVAEDERSVAVALTADGERMRGLTAGIQQQICASSGLPLDDLQALRAQVAALAESVRAVS